MNIIFNNKYTLNNLRVQVRNFERKTKNTKEIVGKIYGKYSFWKNTLYVDAITILTDPNPEEEKHKLLSDKKYKIIGHWHNHPSGNHDPSYIDEMTMTANAVNKRIPFLLIVTNTNKGTHFHFYKYSLFKQKLVKKIYTQTAIKTTKLFKSIETK